MVDVLLCERKLPRLLAGSSSTKTREGKANYNRTIRKINKLKRNNTKKYCQLLSDYYNALNNIEKALT